MTWGAGVNAVAGRRSDDTVTEIVSTGYAYPRLRVGNDEYLSRCRYPIRYDAAAVARDTRLVSRTWCADDENTWTLARDAVRRALERTPALREEIDVVLVASGSTLPVLLPADPDLPGSADLAPRVLRDIGRDTAIGLDLKACYCTGFLRGLEVMDGLLANPNYRAGIVVATEQGSRLATAPTNRSTFCFIMSDAAGAAVVRKRPAAPRVGLVDYVGHTDASKLDWVAVGADGRSMLVRGADAGSATLEMLVGTARTLLDRNRLRPSDVDWLLPIQTHAQVVDGMRHALAWPQEKLLWRGDVTGFSGSASIPTCLAEQIEKGVVKKGDLILSVAVGAGMNAAGALFHA